MDINNAIIGRSKNGNLRTTFPTSEKFNCKALEDRKKKKENEHKEFVKELDRIYYDNM